MSANNEKRLRNEKRKSCLERTRGRIRKRCKLQLVERYRDGKTYENHRQRVYLVGKSSKIELKLRWDSRSIDAKGRER